MRRNRKAIASRLRRQAQQAASTAIAASRAPFRDPITLDHVPARHGVTLNRQRYDPESLRTWLLSDPQGGTVPTTRRPVTNDERRVINRAVQLKRGAEGWAPLHTMFDSNRARAKSPPPSRAAGRTLDRDYTRGTGRHQRFWNSFDKKMKTLLLDMRADGTDEGDVAQVREMLEFYTSLRRAYPRGDAAVRAAVYGRRWRHITPPGGPQGVGVTRNKVADTFLEQAVIDYDFHREMTPTLSQRNQQARRRAEKRARGQRYRMTV